MSKYNVEDYKVEGIGGNQYRVTKGDEERVLDFDGRIVVTDEDYATMKDFHSKDESPKDEFWFWFETYFTLEDFLNGDEDEGFWLAAAEHQLNYGGFDIEDYIANRS